MRLTPAAVFLLSCVLQAQSPLDIDNLRAAQAMKDQPSTVIDPTPKGTSNIPLGDRSESSEAQRIREDERLDREIRALKAKEKGVRRFAADLFDIRQRGGMTTEGGVAEDYVLGVGDRLQVNVFGSATFEVPTQVDGRGELVIPRVGSVKVAGKTLLHAKQAVQGLVARNFSRSTVDLQVMKLREVRVFVMGEVYKPGAFLVPSLSSLVNVLSLSGGPTALGSYRDIRVVRGGQVVFRLDLYPLRAEGLGNPNVSLQSGDILFVPLAQRTVTLEGAFTRVALGTTDEDLEGKGPKDDAALARERLEREIKSLEDQLRPREKGAEPSRPFGAVAGAEENKAQPAPVEPSLAERKAGEEELMRLKKQLEVLKAKDPSDRRVKLDPTTHKPLISESDDRPAWWRRWEDWGEAPRMVFELKEGESAGTVVQFAGGLLPEAGDGTLSRRFRRPDGVQDAETFSIEGAAKASLSRGDVLSALPRREREGKVILLAGRVRVPGPFARTEGQRVGDLLKRDAQILPDTYLLRGEILRTAEDGTTRILNFDVGKALTGDAAHNLLLEDRDRVELFSVEDQRLPRFVAVSGPVLRPGTYLWHADLRASDLLFRAGVPQKSANRFAAELARTTDQGPSQVRTLDLGRLLSTETFSPVGLKDDAVNPVLQPDDRISLYEKPDFRVHRVVTLQGMVAKPGEYALDQPRVTLSQVLVRAGGLNPDAMVKAGVFLRRIQGNSALARAAEESGVGADDPTTKGINDILGRLNETKRQPTSGLLLRNPILHGLAEGKLNRLVVDFEAAMKGDPKADVELQDGDEIIIPRRTDSAYIVGETASPFATYKVHEGMKVSQILELAGGTTRNADRSNIRLLKADGRILDSWVMSRRIEPGDTVLVPQKIRRDSSWQENLTALTPLALILNAIK